MVGIDFGGTKTAVATATLDGERMLTSGRIETRADDGADQAVARALVAAREVIARTAAAGGGACVAAAAVSPGIVGEGAVLLSPNIPGWDGLALPAAIRTGLGLHDVACGTDVKAAALAEARSGALQGASPAIFLSLGTGIASALIVDGKVLTGAHGASGEIGYALRRPNDAGIAGGRAPLEEAVGGRGLGLRASALLGEPVTAAGAFAHADPRVIALVDDALDELAMHIANHALLVDPVRIAVGGGLMGSGDRILAALERCVRRAVPFPPEIIPAAFADDGALRGALALAAGCVRSPIG